MQLRVSQRNQRLCEYRLEKSPRHGETTLAGGGVTNGAPGQILQVSAQAVLTLADVVDQAHEQLRPADLGRTAGQRRVCGHDPLKMLSGQQARELDGESVCITYAASKSPSSKPLSVTRKRITSRHWD